MGLDVLQMWAKRLQMKVECAYDVNQNTYVELTFLYHHGDNVG